MDDAMPRMPDTLPESREVAAHRERREGTTEPPAAGGTLIIAVVAIVLVAVVGWAVLDGVGVSERPAPLPGPVDEAATAESADTDAPEGEAR